MDLQQIVDNAVKAERAEKMKTSEQLTIGEVILLLKPIVARQKEVKEKYGQEAEVFFDFEYLRPTGIDSWRGIYAELALSFDGEKGYTATEFLSLLEGCIGKTFTGYKGGDYVMGKGTPLWVANYGNSGSTGVVGVIDQEYKVILETKMLPD